MVIIWIEHLNKVSCKIFLLHCLVVVTLVKGLERESVLWLGIPNHK